MTIRTGLMARLGLTVPVIQAPLGGGGDTPAMTAAVAEAGGLGCIGAAYMTPEAIGQAADAVRSRTNRGFGINIFAPQRPAPVTDAGRAIDSLAALAADLGLEPPAVPVPVDDPFGRLFPAALESGARVFSFTFGTIPAGATAALKARGIMVIGTATTVREAVALKASGVDAIIAQGGEAGGHRGSFDADGPGAMVGTVALVPQVIDATGLPVIASGGIMDGRGIAAALALGADAVQMGTAFLTTAESGVADCHRQAILDAADDDTRVTRAFSGRPARGIANRFMDGTDAAGPDAILPFPLQNALTRPMRTAAAKAGRAEYLSLWAGQGTRLARRSTTAELMARLERETAAALARLR
ncbi:MAG: nitronate monooxygenase [Pseudomonadota bacterium]|nr:nitronate monooxygenase [Pseudomonadota bacterium]